MNNYFDNVNYTLIDDPKYLEGRDDELREVGIKKKKKQRKTKPKNWEFQEELIFKRYDAFVERLTLVREFFQTSDQFLKLEKVEMGGIRGKNLSSRIIHIFDITNRR